VIYTLFQGILQNTVLLTLDVLMKKTSLMVVSKVTVLNIFFSYFTCLLLDLDFTFLEMNPFTLVNGKPYPLDMRGELDDTAAFKNFKK